MAVSQRPVINTRSSTLNFVDGDQYVYNTYNTIITSNSPESNPSTLSFAPGAMTADPRVRLELQMN
jgi:hypothetical protein